MDQVLQGISKTKCYLDDITVTGNTLEERLANSDTVLQRLQDYGLGVNQSKCQFLQDSVEYCGRLLSATDLRRSDRKVRAIAKMPPPQDVKQLRSFLRMVQYYAKILPDLPSHLAPLHQLLRMGTPWTWEPVHDSTFNTVRAMLLLNIVLAHFDSSLPITLACDSSSYGLGTVLSHQLPDCGERPIAYASWSLTTTEQKYAQIEREALALYCIGSEEV